MKQRVYVSETPAEWTVPPKGFFPSDGGTSESGALAPGDRSGALLCRCTLAMIFGSLLHQCNDGARNE